MLFIRVLERVRDPSLGKHNKSTIKGGPKPRNMSMPKKGALLLNQCEFICESLPWLYRALGYVRRSIKPARESLPHPMPAIFTYIYTRTAINKLKIINGFQQWMKFLTAYQ